MSGNLCAFPECGKKLVDEKGRVFGEICHIEAANPGGERYNSNSSDEYRRSFENLILMCHDHHIITDDVNDFDVQILTQFKNQHTAKYMNVGYTVTDEIANRTLEKQINVVVRNEIIQTTNLPERVVTAILDSLEDKKVEVAEWQKKALDLEEKYNEVIKNLSNSKDEQEVDVKKMIDAGEFDLASETIKNNIKSNEDKNIISYLNLSSIAELDSNIEKAIEYCITAYNIDSKNIAVNFKIGILYKQIGKYRESIFHLKNFVKETQELSGYADLLLSSYSLLSGNYSKLEDWENTNYWIDKGNVLIAENSLKDILTVAAFQNQIGIYFMESDQRHEAVGYFENVLKALTLNTPKARFEVVAVYDNLLYSWQEIDNNKSLFYGQQGISYVLNNYGENSIYLNKLYINIARTYLLKEDYPNCLYYVNKGLALTLDKYPLNANDLAGAYNVLGQMYYYQREVDKAISYFESSLKYKLIKRDPNHSAIAMIYGNLGNAYCFKNEYEKGVEYLLKALNIDKNKLGSDSISVAIDSENISMVYLDLKDFDKAIVHSNSAINIYLKDSRYNINRFRFFVRFADRLFANGYLNEAKKWALKAKQLHRNNKFPISESHEIISSILRIVK